MRTKSEFKAIRERVGITQEHLAQMMGVATRSVRYWEDQRQPMRNAPDEAWGILDSALAWQREVIAFALAKVDEIIENRGSAPKAVNLPYWKNQADYLANSTDAKQGVAGDYHMANANNLAVSIILEQRGIAVEWVDGNPARPQE